MIMYETRPYPGSWTFGGGGALFRYVYRDVTIKEVAVFETASFRLEDIAEWLVRDDAFFFRMALDGEPVWTDATKTFEDLALSRLSENVDELLRQKELGERVLILRTIVEKHKDQPPFLYRYASALQDVGQVEGAMEYSIALWD